MGQQAVGVVAIAGAILAFGSFGVPIKSERLQRSQVHPIVVQAYKSAACFGTCWLALLWVPVRFTWWAMLGATMWVTNGVAAIVAIQTAGLAVSQALWSGISVFVAFVWGAVIFSEPVGNLALAITGLCIMACGMGIIGVIVNPSISGASCSTTHVTQFATAACHRRQGSQHHRQGAQPVIAETLPLAPWLDVNNFRESPSEAAASLNVPSNSCDCASTSGPLACVQADANSEQFSSPICSPSLKGVSYPSLGQAASAQDETLPSFSVGISCAVFIGVSNGSFMVPFKYASRSVTGLEFVVPFGIGAAVVSFLSIIAYGYLARVQGRPPLQLKLWQAGPPALLAGILWSFGNVLSIIATQELGMAITWPAVQAQLVVSTAWGVLWCRESRDLRQGVALLTATIVIILGVVCLALSR